MLLVYEKFECSPPSHSYGTRLYLNRFLQRYVKILIRMAVYRLLSRKRHVDFYEFDSAEVKMIQNEKSINTHINLFA